MSGNSRVIKSLIKECKYCGKKFHPHRRENIFCSIKCSSKVNKPPIITRENRKRKYWMNKKWLEEHYENRTISISKLSREINYCARSISGWLKYFNIEIKAKTITQKGKRNPFFGKKHEEKALKKMRVKRPSITGNKNYNWKGGLLNYYGENWRSQRRKVVLRDKNTCQRCGTSRNYTARNMDVHHIVPFKLFGVSNYIEANKLINLICLCSKCHSKVEYLTNKTLCKKKSHCCFTETRQYIVKLVFQP